MNYTLNPDQKRVADDVADFILDPARRQMRISGPGGTGKSVLISHFCNELLPTLSETAKSLGVDINYKHIHITATTNNAAEILAQMTGKETSTIHSALGLAVCVNYKTGGTFLAKRKNFQDLIEPNSIIVVDEASLVCTTVYSELVEKMKTCKVIFVCDDCQAPPINERLSKALSTPMTESFLSASVRFKDNLVLGEIATYFRSAAKEQQSVSAVFDKEVSKSIKRIQTEEELEEALHDMFDSADNTARVLSYTNAVAESYCDTVSNLYGLPLSVAKNDIAISLQPYRSPNFKVSIPTDAEVFIQEIDAQGLDFSITLSRTNEQLSFKYSRVKVIPYGGRNAHEVVSVFMVEDSKEYDKVMKRIAFEKEWKTFYEIKETFLVLRKNYACTVHKAQGKTLKKVMIDLDSFASCNQFSTALRLLYVSFSRATETVYLVGELPEFLGQILWEDQ